MSADMLPNSAGPVQRAMAEEYAARRARLFNTPAPTPKAIVRPRTLSPFDPRRLDIEIAAAIEANPPPPMPPWKVVLTEVAKKHGVSVADITGTARTQAIVPARNECAYRMVIELGMTLEAAGRRLNREHTTVRHAVGRHIARNPELAAAVDALSQSAADVEAEIIRLYFDEDKTPAAISRQIGVSPSMIHAAVRREVRRVRDARKAA